MQNSGDVIFEFQRVGAAVKVVAIDVATGIEAAIVGPAASGEAVLRRAARQKLAYIIARRA